MLDWHLFEPFLDLLVQPMASVATVVGSEKKELAPSLDCLTLGPEPVLLLSARQEAAPCSHLPCLQCPGMRSAGNDPGRYHAVQGTEVHPSTVPAESTL